MSDLSEITKCLRVLPCLSALNNREVEFIGEMASLKRIERDAMLFMESDPADFFFVLKHGTIKLSKRSPEGREFTLKLMHPGDYFCCAPVYGSGKHLVGARALEDSLLIAVPAQKFKLVLKSGVGETGWRMITGLCSRIQHLSSLVEDLSFKEVEQRVVATLLRLADERAPSQKLVSLQMTHQDIAALTGTVREVVSRTMSKLKKKGMLQSTVRGFTLDREKLSSILDKKLLLP